MRKKNPKLPALQYLSANSYMADEISTYLLLNNSTKTARARQFHTTTIAHKYCHNLVSTYLGTQTRIRYEKHKLSVDVSQGD